MTTGELKEVIRLHQLWLNDDKSGKKADLSWADLSWANLSEADLSGANLREADLSWANLSGANLSGADLRGADLREADLSWANLSEANLRGANLREADLSEADLSEADLRGIPVVENLDAKILASISNGQPRLGVVDGKPSLEMSMWHSCGTAHCRAGWAITLAGKAGAELEAKMGSCVAGALIYHASTGNVPNFYESNEDALRSIQVAAARAEAGREGGVA